MTVVRRWPTAKEARNAGIGLHTKNDDHISPGVKRDGIESAA